MKPKLPQVIITCAVEDDIDEAVALHLIADAGAAAGPVHGNKGQPYLLKNLRGFNNAARHAPWLVLLDLDTDAECPPAFVTRHLPSPAARMSLRVAVREVESWLIADRQAFARFIGVPVRRLPLDPDALENPKQFVVNLARRSRKTDIKEDLVPSQNSGRTIGRGYPSRLIEFVRDHWSPTRAEPASQSLMKCRRQLRMFAGERSAPASSL